MQLIHALEPGCIRLLAAFPGLRGNDHGFRDGFDAEDSNFELLF